MGNVPTTQIIDTEFQKKNEMQQVLMAYTDSTIKPNYISYQNAQPFTTFLLSFPSITYNNGPEKTILTNSNNGNFIDYNSTTRTITFKAYLVVAAEFRVDFSNIMSSELYPLGIKIFKNNQEIGRVIVNPAYKPLDMISGRWTNDGSATIEYGEYANTGWKDNDAYLNNTSEGCRRMCENTPQCVGWSETATGPISTCFLKRNLNNLNGVGGGYNTRTIFTSNIRASSYFSVVPGDTLHFEVTRSCTILNDSIVIFSVLFQK